MKEREGEERNECERVREKRVERKSYSTKKNPRNDLQMKINYRMTTTDKSKMRFYYIFQTYIQKKKFHLFFMQVTRYLKLQLSKPFY